MVVPVSFAVGEIVTAAKLNVWQQAIIDLQAAQVPTWHNIGAVGEPAYQNSWVNYGGAWQVGQFAAQNGWLMMRGLIKSGTVGTAFPIFVLPAGFRPTADRSMGTMSNTGASIQNSRLSIMANGQVVLDNGGNTFCSLEIAIPIT